MLLTSESSLQTVSNSCIPSENPGAGEVGVPEMSPAIDGNSVEPGATCSAPILPLSPTQLGTGGAFDYLKGGPRSRDVLNALGLNAFLGRPPPPWGPLEP